MGNTALTEFEILSISQSLSPASISDDCKFQRYD